MQYLASVQGAKKRQCLFMTLKLRNDGQKKIQEEFENHKYFRDSDLGKVVKK
jgi:hypothetical protein